MGVCFSALLEISELYILQLAKELTGGPASNIFQIPTQDSIEYLFNEGRPLAM